MRKLIILTADKDGNVLIHRDELQTLVDEAYAEGLKDGVDKEHKFCTPIWAPNTTPYKPLEFWYGVTNGL